MHLHTCVLFYATENLKTRKKLYSKLKGLLNIKQMNKMSDFVISTQFNSQTVNALAKKKITRKMSKLPSYSC